MIKYPQPIPFSPTQEDLDRLVTALTPEHQAKADKKAKWDESEQVAKLISWDRDHSVRYLFKDLFSSSNIGIKNAAISFLVSALIVPLRTLFFPFRLLVRLVLIPSRPARPINNRTPGRFTPLHLEAGAIRRFDDIVDAVFIYEKAYDDRPAEAGPDRNEDIKKSYLEEALLEQCAQISSRMVEPEIYAHNRRQAATSAASDRRRSHLTNKCGVKFKKRMAFITPTKRKYASYSQKASGAKQQRTAEIRGWKKLIADSGSFFPSAFRYEYHDVDAKPHTVLITFDLSSISLKIARLEARQMEREYLINPDYDYLPDEETGSFERTPQEERWREFLDYLIREKLHECPVSLKEVPVRAVSWTLDVEFGDYEVHVGDDQTGPLGDKLSTMVGRLIA